MIPPKIMPAKDEGASGGESADFGKVINSLQKKKVSSCQQTK
jgi:hypothetical protein